MDKKTVENRISQKRVQFTTVMKFMRQLYKPGNTSKCSLTFPCIIVKTDLKDNKYVSLIHKCLSGMSSLYKFYYFDCDDAESKQMTEFFTEDVRYRDNRKAEFDILIVDELSATNESVYVSFGTVRELYEYVMNRALKPDEPLSANLYTRPKWVSGLVSVSVFSSKSNKVIILGEIHDRLGTCTTRDDAINASDFFISLLEKNKRTFIDVYGEFNIQMGGYPTKERKLDTLEVSKNQVESFMFDTQRSLDSLGCLYGGSVEGKNCIYNDYVRFHSTDVRDSKISSMQFYSSVFWIWDSSTEYLRLSDEDSKNNVKEELKSWCKETRTIMERVQELSTVAGMIEDIVNATEYLKIDKHISKMKIDHEKRTILIYIERFTVQLSEHLEENLFPRLLELFDALEYGNVDEDSGVVEDLVNLTYPVSRISTYLMDLYLLTRLLLTHRGDVRAKNSIIYVGNTHANLYKQVLTDMNFEPVFDSVRATPHYACLDISELMWPYF